MEIIRHDEMDVFVNPGVTSSLLLRPGNASAVRVTITRVALEPGAISARRHLREG